MLAWLLLKATFFRGTSQREGKRVQDRAREAGRRGEEGQDSSQEWEMRNTARMSAPDFEAFVFFLWAGL